MFQGQADPRMLDLIHRNLNRLRWTIRPEADLFVVWNRGWKHAIGDDEARFAPLADQFLVKLRWIFRR